MFMKLNSSSGNEEGGVFGLQVLLLSWINRSSSVSNQLIVPLEIQQTNNYISPNIFFKSSAIRQPHSLTA